MTPFLFACGAVIYIVLVVTIIYLSDELQSERALVQKINAKRVDERIRYKELRKRMDAYEARERQFPAHEPGEDGPVDPTEIAQQVKKSAEHIRSLGRRPRSLLYTVSAQTYDIALHRVRRNLRSEFGDRAILSSIKLYRSESKLLDFGSTYTFRFRLREDNDGLPGSLLSTGNAHSHSISGRSSGLEGE